MADHSELKGLAEACGNLNWRFQQENWTEYAIRDDHGYIATMRVGSPKQAGPDPDREAKAKFLGAMTPAAVLGLIAENEALKGPHDWLAEDLIKELVDNAQAIQENADDGEEDQFVIVLLASASRIRRQEANIDQLRAEIAGLLTGYEAYEAQNAGLKAEVEALRKDAERYRWLRIADWWRSPMCVIRNPKDQAKLGSDCPRSDRLDAAIDAAIGKGEQS